MTSYQYRKSHCGDKTILRPSYLHNGISYTGKMISLYWIGAQVPCVLPSAGAAVDHNRAAQGRTFFALIMLTPYGDINFKQKNWPRKCLAAWWHQAIIWTSVDLLSEVFHGVHLRTISQVLMNLLIHMLGDYTSKNYTQISQGPMV